MADFWRGFGEGFSKQASRSWERAADKRARREELEDQRKYQERIAEEKEIRDRRRMDDALNETLALRAGRPSARKLFDRVAAEKRGIGPSPEAASETFVSPLLSSAERFRRESGDALSKGGRVLREKGDIIGALRDSSLEKKTAWSRQLDLDSELYKEALEKDVETVGTMASALALVDYESAEAGKYKKETDDIKKRYEGDSNALTKFRNAALGAGANVAKELGLWRMKEELSQDYAADVKEEEFKMQEPDIIKLIERREGERPGSEWNAETYKEEARRIFYRNGISSLEKQAEDAESFRMLQYIANAEGTPMPEGTSLGVAKDWAKANLDGFKTPTEAEKKLGFIKTFKDDYSKALERVNVLKNRERAGLSEDELARHLKEEADAGIAEKKAGNELEVALAITVGKGWELDVEDGELVAVKLDTSGERAGYGIGFVPQSDGGVKAFAKLPPGFSKKPKEERDRILAESAADIDANVFQGVTAGWTAGGDVVGGSNKASKQVMGNVRGQRELAVIDAEITRAVDQKKKLEPEGRWTTEMEKELGELQEMRRRMQNPAELRRILEAKDPAKNPIPIPALPK